MRNNSIKTNVASPETAYVTWSDDKSRASAIQQSSSFLGEEIGVSRSAGSYRDFSDLLPGMSSKPGFNRTDRDYYRPNDILPTKHKEIMEEAQKVYDRVGIIKNVHDLMSDFSTKGVRISHPIPAIQQFYRNWFIKVEGLERSERFANIFTRLGNVCIKRQTAKIKPKLIRKMRSKGANIDIVENKVEKRTIPWKYTFINPKFLCCAGLEQAAFVVNPTYAIQVPQNLYSKLKSPSSQEELDVINSFPADLRKAINTSDVVPLEPESTIMYFYKKDDWNYFAKPMTYSIFDDVRQLEKLKLADRAALDGVISNIRIFKLGSLEHKIAPLPAAAARLSSILQSNVGGGMLDIIWDDAIDVWESQTHVHEFLGEDKYKPTWSHIYAALGVPPSLTGMFGAAGTTNNYISLKTLIKRLEYVRSNLVDFWMAEIKMVHEALGFTSQLPTVEFDSMSLSDEEARLSLLVDMADRSIISDESVQLALGQNPSLETGRLSREQKQREKEKRPQKAGPYHESDKEHALKKLALQTGVASPGEVGLELEEKKEGEKSLMDVRSEQMKLGGKEPGKKGEPEQGRPKNSRDKTKRKEKKFKPKNKASVQIWAIDAQKKIAEILNPGILSSFKKSSMRSLTAEQTELSEKIKAGVLFNLEPLESVDKKHIEEALNKTNNPIIQSSYNEALVSFAMLYGRKPSIDEARLIQTNIYSENNYVDD